MMMRVKYLIAGIAEYANIFGKICSAEIILRPCDDVVLKVQSGKMVSSFVCSAKEMLLFSFVRDWYIYEGEQRSYNQSGSNFSRTR
jgi:hypothetical protein